jgi:hypothetical protein
MHILFLIRDSFLSSSLILLSGKKLPSPGI